MDPTYLLQQDMAQKVPKPPLPSRNASATPNQKRCRQHTPLHLRQQNRQHSRVLIAKTKQHGTRITENAKRMVPMEQRHNTRTRTPPRMHPTQLQTLVAAARNQLACATAAIMLRRRSQRTNAERTGVGTVSEVSAYCQA